jgi:hypothetical protein
MRSTNVVYRCQSVTRLTESLMAFVDPTQDCKLLGTRQAV